MEASEEKNPTPRWFGRGEAGRGLGSNARIYAQAGPGAGRQAAGVVSARRRRARGAHARPPAKAGDESERLGAVPMLLLPALLILLILFCRGLRHPAERRDDHPPSALLQLHLRLLLLRGLGLRHRGWQPLLCQLDLRSGRRDVSVHCAG